MQGQLNNFAPSASQTQGQQKSKYIYTPSFGGAGLIGKTGFAHINSLSIAFNINAPSGHKYLSTSTISCPPQVDKTGSSEGAGGLGNTSNESKSVEPKLFKFFSEQTNLQEANVNYLPLYPQASKGKGSGNPCGVNKLLLEDLVNNGQGNFGGKNSKIISYNFNKDIKIVNSLAIITQPSIPMLNQSKFNNLTLASLSPADGAMLIEKEEKRVAAARKKNWFLVEDLQKILISYFKSIYSLISKVKFKFSSDKIILEIFYYITIPDANIFTWYNIIYSQKKDKQGSLFKGISAPQSAGDKQINYLKRKNKLIKLLKKNAPSIPSGNLLSPKEGKKEKLFKLNTININKLYSSKFNSLLKFLSNLFNKPIELDLIRLHHSDSDSYILAQLFLLVLKKKNIRSIINKLFNKNKVLDINQINYSYLPNSGELLSSTGASAKGEQSISYSNYIPVFISGLYFHIGGRLMREPIIPRITTKKFEKGAIAIGKVNSLEKTQITKKNKKGAYTLKISFAQNTF